MAEREVDVVVIGAGPAGEVAAGRLGEADVDVVLVERELVGGECSYWACMPSKALLRPFQALRRGAPRPRRPRGGHRRARRPRGPRRRDEVIHDLDDGEQLPWLEDRGVELVRGHGRLDGERRVVVGDDAYAAAQGRHRRDRQRPGLPADRRA